MILILTGSTRRTRWGGREGGRGRGGGREGGPTWTMTPMLPRMQAGREEEGSWRREERPRTICFLPEGRRGGGREGGREGGEGCEHVDETS